MKFSTFLEAQRFLKGSPDRAFELLKNNKNVDFDLSLRYEGDQIKLGMDAVSDLKINPSREIIYINSDNYEYDPYIVGILRDLSSDFNHYKIYHKNQLLGSLGEIKLLIKNKAVDSPSWSLARYAHKSNLKRYVVPLIKEIWQQEFYHATFLKYVENILKNGLHPGDTVDTISKKLNKNSLTFDELGQAGWSPGWNFDKHHAVYLSLDKNSTDNLAKYLATRNQEDSVVLKINGKGIKDSSKLIADEDSMRSEFDDALHKSYRGRVPPFYVSAKYMKTIAYKGIIDPSYITVVERFKPDAVDD